MADAEKRVVIDVYGRIPDVEAISKTLGADLDEEPIHNVHMEVEFGGNPSNSTQAASVEIEDVISDGYVMTSADSTDESAESGAQSDDGYEPSFASSIPGDDEEPDEGAADDASDDEAEYTCPACGGEYDSWSSLQGHTGTCEQWNPEEHDLPPKPGVSASSSSSSADSNGSSRSRRSSPAFAKPEKGVEQSPPPTGKSYPKKDSNIHRAIVSLAWLLEDTDMEWACSHEVSNAAWCPLSKLQVSSALGNAWRGHEAVERRGRTTTDCSQRGKGEGQGTYEIAYRLTDHGREIVSELGEFAWPDDVPAPGDEDVSEFAVVRE